MPRKPKLPPFEIVVQGLSTGEPVGPRTFVDDLSGEVILMAEHYGPYKPPADLDTLKRQRKQQVVEHQRMLLQAVGILPGQATLQRPQVELIPKGKRKIGQVGDKAMLIDMPKWRRL